jgi:hypothetical protein
MILYFNMLHCQTNDLIFIRNGFAQRFVAKDDWIIWGTIAVIGISTLLFWPVVLSAQEVNAGEGLHLGGEGMVPSDRNRLEDVH